MQLSLLEEEADGLVAVWGALDDAQRAAIITTLARVMTTLAVAEHTQAAQETSHE